VTSRLASPHQLCGFVVARHSQSI